MITTLGITKTYGHITALEHVSIDISAGAITGILGPNGSGKSTLFRIILGLTPADTGQVTICDEVQPRGATTGRRRIAYVPDSDELYEDLTPAEFARLAWRLHAQLDHSSVSKTFPLERFEALCEVFQLTEHAHRRCRILSHGMRRKTQLVAALACRPPMLVIDEPTNGLDPDQHIVLRLVLRALADQGSTVLISTHNLGFAESLADYVILLRSRVARSGTPAQVLAETEATSLTEAYEHVTGMDRAAISRQADAAFQ